MIKPELDQVIAAIERTCAKQAKTVTLANSHRWEQTLDILKFYRRRWDELEPRHYADLVEGADL